MKLLVQVIKEHYVYQLCTGHNILVDVRIGKPPASDIMENVTTKALHWKCPVSPDWTHSPDSWCNMQQCMNSEGTSSNTHWIMFVVQTMNPLDSILSEEERSMYCSYSLTQRWKPFSRSSS